MSSALYKFTRYSIMFSHGQHSLSARAAIKCSAGLDILWAMPWGETYDAVGLLVIL